MRSSLTSAQLYVASPRLQITAPPCLERELMTGTVRASYLFRLVSGALTYFRPS
jgi:hypothetical protein